MVNLTLRRHALDELDRLESAGEFTTVDRIDDALETLAADPTSAEVRRHRLNTDNGGVWVLPVARTEYAIFWNHELIDTEVTVYLILVWSPAA